MSDNTKPIIVATGDNYHVCVSAGKNPFRYKFTQFRPDGSGGFEHGQIIGSGEGEHSQWLGADTESAGTVIEVCVTHGAAAETCQADIRIDLERELGSGVSETVKSWTIRTGVAPGDYKCLVFQFQ